VKLPALPKVMQKTMAFLFETIARYTLLLKNGNDKKKKLISGKLRSLLQTEKFKHQLLQ
jgi:hypothetical protein